jgi:hypothetical protein
MLLHCHHLQSLSIHKIQFVYSPLLVPFSLSLSNVSLCLIVRSLNDLQTLVPLVNTLLPHHNIHQLLLLELFLTRLSQPHLLLNLSLVAIPCIEEFTSLLSGNVC